MNRMILGLTLSLKEDDIIHKLFTPSHHHKHHGHNPSTHDTH